MIVCTFLFTNNKHFNPVLANHFVCPHTYQVTSFFWYKFYIHVLTHLQKLEYVFQNSASFGGIVFQSYKMELVHREPLQPLFDIYDIHPYPQTNLQSTNIVSIVILLTKCSWNMFLSMIRAVTLFGMEDICFLFK